MVSLVYTGRIIGCIFTAVAVDKFGRNAIISLTAILLTISWTSTVFIKIVPMHYFFRLVFGICAGIANIATPMYVGENSSPSVRGVFGSICLIFFYSGQGLGSILATFCSYELSSGILAALSLVSLASVVLLREPAQYLLSKGLDAKAERHFFWLRGNAENVKLEFDETKAKIVASSQTEFSFAYLLDRRVQIVCIVSSLLFLTGFPIISLLVSVILSPTKQFSSNELTILLELIQFFGAAISPLVIDRYNRRTLWFFSSSLAILFHLMTAVLFYSKEIGFQVANYSWLLFGSVSAYTTLFSSLINSLSYAARGELLPQKYKAVGSCTSQIMNSMIGTVLGRIFLEIAAAFGMKMNFIIFAVCSFVLLVFCFFYVPETRGIPLVEIEKSFEKSKKFPTNTAQK